MLTEEQIAINPVRYERRVTDGQGLYLLITPVWTSSRTLAVSLPPGKNKTAGPVFASRDRAARDRHQHGIASCSK